MLTRMIADECKRMYGTLAAIVNKSGGGGRPFGIAALAGVLDPERVVQIGIRGRAEPH